MTSDSTLIQQGAEAAELLEHPAFRRAFNTLRDQIHRQWLSTSVKDTAEQTALLQLGKAAEKLEKLLIAEVTRGDEVQKRIQTDALRNESRARGALRRVGL